MFVSSQRKSHKFATQDVPTQNTAKQTYEKKTWKKRLPVRLPPHLFFQLQVPNFNGFGGHPPPHPRFFFLKRSPFFVLTVLSGFWHPELWSLRGWTGRIWRGGCSWQIICNFTNTVDGSEILHQLRLVVYPIIYRVLYIPGGAGFLPTIVWSNLTPQKHDQCSFDGSQMMNWENLHLFFFSSILIHRMKATSFFFQVVKSHGIVWLYGSECANLQWRYKFVQAKKNGSWSNY